MVDDEATDRWRLGIFLRATINDWVGVVGLAVLPFFGGCGPARYMEPDRLAQGYAIVLPGIEGTSQLNRNVAKGLLKGGWRGAVEVYDWTAGSVMLFPVTLRALERNKAEATHIARMLTDYQDAYPGRPVYLIGHSGGGGVAVLTLEAMPAKRHIDGTILLAPAMSPQYRLSKALLRTGTLWNFYSHYDVGFLSAGTTVMGTIDGQHTAAAGSQGFEVPPNLDPEERRLYSTRLRQQAYSRKMLDSGHTGGHLGWANPSFVADWLCPIMAANGPSPTSPGRSGS